MQTRSQPPSGFHLKCVACATPCASTVRELACEVCGGVFEVEYDYAPSALGQRLPLVRPHEKLTLGEGNTPVIELKRLAAELGLGRLWAKLEQIAPTGSFKDRGSAVLMSVAVEHGVREFVEDSSGNAGASLSAFAASAGLKAHVFAPASASPGKLQQISVFGAELHTVAGPRQAATDAARAYVKERGLVYLSHYHSPFFSEGMKAFAYEATRSPAANVRHIVMPVGNGSLLIGASRGYDELRQASAIEVGPKFHCVQAEAVRPLVAVLNGEDWQFDRAGRTVASGIAVSKPPRIEQAIDAVRGTGGSGVAVSDDATLAWQIRLARQEGVFCEPTSAAAFAGLEKLILSGAIKHGEDVLVPITGSGLKEPLQAHPALHI
ncbi:MAG: pyridoxal-phosphate dependent enzyme [Dehalococcoidia bacterium]|nr:pyridoxal-phosphate dependent enzyme [Dehalococcoidia bacterium]MSQ34469.1 pyridoxal-phosphate dependent enzyme [Dehalococcoidia bacterium]